MSTWPVSSLTNAAASAGITAACGGVWTSGLVVVTAAGVGASRAAALELSAGVRDDDGFGADDGPRSSSSTTPRPPFPI